MKNVRHAIRSILADDALYRREDIPGDVDDPPDSGCGCKSECHCEEDFVTPKYALYSLIGDAIRMYDQMESESTGNPEIDDLIVNIAREIKRTVG
jgi:hypothetical protein